MTEGWHKYISGQNSIKPCECQEKMAKLPVMSIYFKILMLWVGIVLISGLTVVYADDTAPNRNHPNIIVLDPGHGGNDTGARSTDDMTEKQVVMTFAGLMTERLTKTYQVFLTRKDDYQVDLFERPALANHLMADLFISLHTGGSLRSFPRGMSLFYYERARHSGTTLETQASNPPESSNTIKPWEQDRPDLVQKSRHLAELIRRRLDQTDKTLKLTSLGAPLIVMSGADMPAVLIEIGYITNPLDAKMLKDELQLATLAGHVCDAIDDFFADNLKP